MSNCHYNNKMSVRIKCPYFLSVAENRRDIACEGLLDGVKLVNSFPAMASLSDWIRDVCETHGYVDRCLIAKAIDRKYGEGG